jgi:small multidrug resistance family-3 protein
MTTLRILGFLATATVLEVSGDAVIRRALFGHTGVSRVGLMCAGALLLYGYGLNVNLAPLEFGQVAGLYIATLFVVWQVINAVAFRDFPTPPIALGGALIVTGGLMVSFWKS